MKTIKVGENYLTLKYYKEPLKKIPKKDGVGFYGALLETEDGEKVQCHICGKLLHSLPGHIYQTHQLRARKYKERFKLSLETSLISEKLRQVQKENTLKWLNSMTEKERKELDRKRIEGVKKAIKEGRMGIHRVKISLEAKNKRGTCPDQLLEKIKEVAKKLGHTPSKAEFITELGTQKYIHQIYKTFGSWKNGIKMAKLQGKIHIRAGGRKRYSVEELLEYLRIFAMENNKAPTYTDFKRGGMPGYKSYALRFGKIENARQLSGIYNFPGIERPIKWKK